MSLFQLDFPVRKLTSEKAAERLRVLEGPFSGDSGKCLQAAGLSSDLFPSALGTIGGGNHFCEVQAAHRVLEPEALAEAGLDPSLAVMLVYSGSRGFGAQIFESVPQSFEHGLAPASETGQAYLLKQDLALVWATLNPELIALRAATAL